MTWQSGIVNGALRYAAETGNPLLSIVIPTRSLTDTLYLELRQSIRNQTLPASCYEVIPVTEGNSEEAKAIGIQRAKGKWVVIFCADNFITSPDFLVSHLWCLQDPYIVGAYSCRYEHRRRDKALSRYFALFGANDPLCWWLGKNDRDDYITAPHVGPLTLTSPIPSVGCNGFFVRRDLMLQVVKDPSKHFPMDAVEDLVALGHNRFYKTDTVLWHRSGESLWDYFRRRYVYARELYFKQLGKRRWHMVGRGDIHSVGLFVLSSLLVVPHLWTSLRGTRRVHDWAWFLHAPVCLGITLLYGACFLRWTLSSLLSSARSTGGRSSTDSDSLLISKLTSGGS